MSSIRIAGAAILCVALTAFYVVAAGEHGRRVNVSKARGDQSGYLWDAENVYANWHGRQPPTVIGERNRMPLYAGYLALFYHQGLPDPEFFEVAKRANIYLSVGLLFGLGLIFFRELPALAAVNVTGIVAFGYFIFKAGYAQSELLFYFLLFLTFLGCWHLMRGHGGWRSAALGGLAGACAGLAHLTKAAMVPFVAIFLITYCGSLVARVARVRRDEDANRRTGVKWQGAAALAFLVAFLVVLWPYLSTSKRVFGEYFYNVNSTFYVWYDDWAHASVGTYVHGDGVGWPTMPESELPGPGRYWREHSVGQILNRFVSGFEDMALNSYRMFGYLPYLVVYLAMLGTLVTTRWTAVSRLLREHLWLAVFIVAYAKIYVLAIAFYYPTSGTGTGRFVLAHLTPFFFATSALFASKPLRETSWFVAGRRVGMQQFNLLVLGLLVLDVAFRLWPRLMTTYGGF